MKPLRLSIGCKTPTGSVLEMLTEERSKGVKCACIVGVVRRRAVSRPHRSWVRSDSKHSFKALKVQQVPEMLEEE